MSTIELPADRLDKISDWMNPILVKETRQALKSRVFIGTFMLLLISSWLICVFGIAMLGSQIEYGSPSATFFRWFYGVLSVAVIMIVPFNSFRSLLTEQDSQTYELLSITALSPRQIVSGKLLNAVIQILVFYCAISPFIAFTSLLQGFDLFTTIILMTSLLGFSILLSMFTLMLSTAAKNKQIQSLATLFIFGGLMSAILMTLGLSFPITVGGVALDVDFFWVLAVWWIIGFSYFLLFHQITVAQLTFEAGNKATGVRLIATGQFLLVWAIVAGSYFLYGSIDRDLFQIMVVVSIMHWTAFGFFIAMERDYLSRRVRRDLPQSALFRFLLVPFMPGGTRGYLLLLINLVVLGGITSYLSLVLSSRIWNDGLGVIAMIAYLIIYYGIGCALGRWLLRKSQAAKPAHTRSLLVVFFVFGIAVPMIILYAIGFYRTSSYTTNYHLLSIMNPFTTVAEISDRNAWSPIICPILLAGASVTALINLPAMLLAAKEIIFPKRSTNSNKTSEAAKTV